MKIESKKRKFQQGGMMPAGEAPEAAPQEGMEQPSENPMEQILQVAAQAVETQNCEAAMAVCQALMQLAQGGQQEAPQEPTFARKGAKLTRVR